MRMNAEDVSSTMYRRALALHEASKQPASPSNDGEFTIRGLLSSIMGCASKFLGDEDKPRPEQFSFYVHARPDQFMEEVFCRVDMKFDGNGFTDPKFKHFDVIPEALQNAYYKTTMPTVTPKDVLRLEGF